MNGTPKKVFRCAIYTRKSTEHNLDLEFNSLDAQREEGHLHGAASRCAPTPRNSKVSCPAGSDPG